MVKNLYIAQTAFHLYCLLNYFDTIDNLDDSKLIYIGKVSKKERHYLSKLNIQITTTVIATYKSRLISSLKILLYAVFKLDTSECRNVYCANYKVIYTRLLLMFFRRVSNYYLFDDGVGSLLARNWLLLEEKTISRLFFSIFSPAMLYKNFQELPRAFTIYKDFSTEAPHLNLSVNAVNSVVENVKQGKSKLLKRVLLGQSYSTDTSLMSRQAELKTYQNFIKQAQIDIFVPHPRNIYSGLELNCKVYDGCQVAEEYLLNLLKSFHLDIYGVRTTTLVNIDRMLTHPALRPSLNLTNVNLTTARGELLSIAWEEDFWTKNYECIKFKAET